MNAGKPKREWVPLDRMIRDPGLQMRSGLADGLTDPASVERYLEAIAEGYELPPLETVSDGETFWLVDGFQRAAAIEGAGRGSAECLVHPGGRDDALLRALAANARHGLTRTAKDCRRAVMMLLDTPRLLARVLAQAGDRGGVHRLIAATCGVSKTLVAKILDERGLRVLAGKLVKKRAAAAAEPEPYDTERIPSSDLPDVQSPPAASDLPQTAAGPFPEVEPSAANRDIDRAWAAVKTLWSTCRTLLDGPWSAQLLGLAERHGVPFRAGNGSDQPLTGGDKPISAIAWWEPFGKIEAVLADLSALAASDPHV